MSEEPPIIPTSNDVLTGRGNGPQQHAGNQQFRSIIERHRQTYATLKKTAEKQAIAHLVWKEIQELDPPGRFLKQHKGTENGQRWSVEEDSKVISKIKQALREKRQEILERQESNKSRLEEEGASWDIRMDKVDPLYPEGDATIGNIPVDIESEESRKGWLDPSRRTEEYLTLDTSSESLEISDGSFKKLSEATISQNPPLPPLQSGPQEGLLHDVHHFPEAATVPRPNEDLTPRQDNTKHIPHTEENPTVMKRRFLPREVSLGRGPGPGLVQTSNMSMRDVSLSLIDNSMGSMVITDESFQRLSEGDVCLGMGDVNVDPIQVSDTFIQSQANGFEMSLLDGNGENRAPALEASTLPNANKEKYLPRDRLLGRDKESSNTGASARFVDTSVGMIDLSMKSLDLMDTNM